MGRERLKERDRARRGGSERVRESTWRGENWRESARGGMYERERVFVQERECKTE